MSEIPHEYIVDFETNVLYDNQTAKVCFKSKSMKKLVRCKDCIWWYGNGKKNGVASCLQDALIRDRDFFCARGQEE